MGKLAEDGIDREMVEASLNTIEFQLREKNTGGFPRGLAAFIGVGWLLQRVTTPLGAWVDRLGAR